MRRLYRENRYFCGEYLDAYIFPVYKQAKTRGKKARPTSEVQERLNARHAVEKMTRLLHANFTPEDLEVGLDFLVNPDNADDALRDVRNYISRVRRRFKKKRLAPLKYLYVVECSTRGRYHVHMTISGGLDRDEMEELWGNGRANSKRLQFDTTGLAGLAHYKVKSPLFYRRWHSSKNLIDPPPEPRTGKVSHAKAKALVSETDNRELFEKLYPGYFLAEATSFHNDVNGGVYLMVRMYRKDGHFIRPARKKKTPSAKSPRGEAHKWLT